jgi:hypothetical protein
VSWSVLHRLDQGAEVAVTREQHHLVDVLGELHGVDGKLDFHVALDLAMAAGVDELFGQLGDDGEAVVVQPVDQGADRREFLVLKDRGVIERAPQGALALKFVQQTLVIDIEAQRFRRGIKIGPIDEERDRVAGN